MGGRKVELPFSNSRRSYEVAMGERRQECRPPYSPLLRDFRTGAFVMAKWRGMWEDAIHAGVAMAFLP